MSKNNQHKNTKLQFKTKISRRFNKVKHSPKLTLNFRDVQENQADNQPKIKLYGRTGNRESTKFIRNAGKKSIVVEKKEQSYGNNERVDIYELLLEINQPQYSEK